MEKNVYRFIIPIKGVGSYLTKIKCSDSDHKILKDSQIELNMVNLSNYGELSKNNAFYWLAKNKFLKRCDLCKCLFHVNFANEAN